MLFRIALIDNKKVIATKKDRYEKHNGLKAKKKN
jgi:hypothetical protein